MNYLIVTSGTGGHFYPGFALAGELRIRNHNCIFCLKKNDPAKNELIKNDFIHFELPVSGFPRQPSLKLLSSAFQSLAGTFTAAGLIKRNNIDCVIALGAYASIPAGIAAKLCGRRLIIHEQNFTPGLANRILSFFCDMAAVSFKETAGFLPGTHTGKTRNVTVTGNPVRPGIAKKYNVAECRQKFGFSPVKFTILVFGGSQGANAFNVTLPEAMAMHGNATKDIQIVHVSGQTDNSQLLSKYRQYNVDAKAFSYLSDMEYAYNACDLVICRSGATTIWELMTVRKPAILIPYPFATGNHQYQNAQYLAGKGTAICIEQQALTAKTLGELIYSLVNDKTKLANMVKAYDKIDVDPLSATKRLADAVEAVVQY